MQLVARADPFLPLQLRTIRQLLGFKSTKLDLKNPQFPRARRRALHHVQFHTTCPIPRFLFQSLLSDLLLSQMLKLLVITMKLDRDKWSSYRKTIILHLHQNQSHGEKVILTWLRDSNRNVALYPARLIPVFQCCMLNSGRLGDAKSLYGSLKVKGNYSWMSEYI